MIAGLLAIWLMLLGLSVAVGQAKGGKWFLGASRRAVMSPVKAGGKAVKRAGRSIWARWQGEILAFGAGVGAVKLMFETQMFLFLLLGIGIATAGWLIGLGIAARRHQAGDYIAWWQLHIAAGVVRIWDNHQWRIICAAAGCIAGVLL